MALIQYAHLTGRPYRVFSLDTGRLNPETYQVFDAVEKHFGIKIEYCFPEEQVSQPINLCINRLSSINAAANLLSTCLSSINVARRSYHRTSSTHL